MKINAQKGMCGVKWVLTEYGEFPAQFSDTAQRIVRDQYFRKGEKSFWDVIERVVNAILEAPRISMLDPLRREELATRLCHLLANQEAAFNSPVWYNLGINPDPQCSACFIQSVQDDMESIMRLARNEAMLFKHGSGTGTNLSNLRASTEKLSGSDGVASGPVSFMSMYDSVANVIKSGGRTRRAAKMQILDCDHPDLLKFIRAKADEDEKAKTLIRAGVDPVEAYGSVRFQNLNSSVRLSDAFMEAASRGEEVVLRDRAGGGTTRVDAKQVLREIAQAAWECGDPGVQFSDTINAAHMVPDAGPINASNPCSEFVFLDESACNLASINVGKFITEDGLLDEDKFAIAVDTLITAMDAIVDISGYPTEEIARNSKKYRPLGLGLTNIGATLMRLGHGYATDDAALDFVELLGKTLQYYASGTSADIAAVWGTHAGYDKDRALRILQEYPSHVEVHGLANAQLTLMAPTGTISFMMDCESTGIEPVFAESTTKLLSGGGTVVIEPECVVEARANGFPVPTAIGAERVDPIQHLEVMEAIQLYLSGAISKTVNLPEEATVEDVEEIYWQAWRRGLKCIAVYRDGCKWYQPMNDNSKAGPVDAPAPQQDRRKLPDERQSITHKFSVGGIDGYLTVGLYDDGTPGEVFVNVAKEGSTASGFMDAWATMLSLYLQHGLPMDKVLDKARGHRFEPSGWTSNKDIPVATSIIDYVAQWLDRKFGGEVPASKMEVKQEWHGDLCPECGAPVIRTGTCKSCPSCGWNGGCG